MNLQKVWLLSGICVIIAAVFFIVDVSKTNFGSVLLLCGWIALWLPLAFAKKDWLKSIEVEIEWKK